MQSRAESTRNHWNSLNRIARSQDKQRSQMVSVCLSPFPSATGGHRWPVNTRGRNATSHVALEVALETKPNLLLLSEEVHGRLTVRLPQSAEQGKATAKRQQSDSNDWIATILLEGDHYSGGWAAQQFARDCQWHCRCRSLSSQTIATCKRR